MVTERSGPATGAKASRDVSQSTGRKSGGDSTVIPSPSTGRHLTPEPAGTVVSTGVHAPSGNKPPQTVIAGGIPSEPKGKGEEPLFALKDPKKLSKKTSKQKSSKKKKKKNSKKSARANKFKNKSKYSLDKLFTKGKGKPSVSGKSTSAPATTVAAPPTTVPPRPPTGEATLGVGGPGPDRKAGEDVPPELPELAFFIGYKLSSDQVSFVEEVLKHQVKYILKPVTTAEFDNEFMLAIYSELHYGSITFYDSPTARLYYKLTKRAFKKKISFSADHRKVDYAFFDTIPLVSGTVARKMRYLGYCLDTDRKVFGRALTIIGSDPKLSLIIGKEMTLPITEWVLRSTMVPVRTLAATRMKVWSFNEPVKTVLLSYNGKTAPVPHGLHQEIRVKVQGRDRNNKELAAFAALIRSCFRKYNLPSWTLERVNAEWVIEKYYEEQADEVTAMYEQHKPRGIFDAILSWFSLDQRSITTAHHKKLRTGSFNFWDYLRHSFFFRKPTKVVKKAVPLNYKQSGRITHPRLNLPSSNRLLPRSPSDAWKKGERLSTHAAKFFGFEETGGVSSLWKKTEHPEQDNAIGLLPVPLPEVQGVMPPSHIESVACGLSNRVLLDKGDPDPVAWGKVHTFVREELVDYNPLELEVEKGFYERTYEDIRGRIIDDYGDLGTWYASNYDFTSLVLPLQPWWLENRGVSRKVIDSQMKKIKSVGNPTSYNSSLSTRKFFRKAETYNKCTEAGEMKPIKTRVVTANKDELMFLLNPADKLSAKVMSTVYGFQEIEGHIAKFPTVCYASAKTLLDISMWFNYWQRERANIVWFSIDMSTFSCSVRANAVFAARLWDLRPNNDPIHRDFVDHLAQLRHEVKVGIKGYPMNNKHHLDKPEATFPYTATDGDSFTSTRNTRVSIALWAYFLSTLGKAPWDIIGVIMSLGDDVVVGIDMDYLPDVRKFDEGINAFARILGFVPRLLKQTSLEGVEFCSHRMLKGKLTTGRYDFVGFPKGSEVYALAPQKTRFVRKFGQTTRVHHPWAERKTIALCKAYVFPRIYPHSRWVVDYCQYVKSLYPSIQPPKEPRAFLGKYGLVASTVDTALTFAEVIDTDYRPSEYDFSTQRAIVDRTRLMVGKFPLMLHEKTPSLYWYVGLATVAVVGLIGVCYYLGDSPEPTKFFSAAELPEVPGFSAQLYQLALDSPELILETWSSLRTYLMFDVDFLDVPLLEGLLRTQHEYNKQVLDFFHTFDIGLVRLAEEGWSRLVYGQKFDPRSAFSLRDYTKFMKDVVSPHAFSLAGNVALMLQDAFTRVCAGAWFLLSKSSAALESLSGLLSPVVDTFWWAFNGAVKFSTAIRRRIGWRAVKSTLSWWTLDRWKK